MTNFYDSALARSCKDARRRRPFSSLSRISGDVIVGQVGTVEKKQGEKMNNVNIPLTSSKMSTIPQAEIVSMISTFNIISFLLIPQTIDIGCVMSEE